MPPPTPSIDFPAISWSVVVVVVLMVVVVVVVVEEEEFIFSHKNQT